MDTASVLAQIALQMFNGCSYQRRKKKKKKQLTVCIMRFTESLKIQKYCSKIVHVPAIENPNLSLEIKKKLVRRYSRES